MKFFKHFLSLLCLATFLFIPQHAFSEEESLVDLLQEAVPELNQGLTGDLLAKSYSSKNYSKKGNYKNQWKPYVAPLFLNAPTRYPYLQVNVGFGLLRFSGLKGGFSRAGLLTTVEQNRFEGGLAYSRTPLVEVILGQQYNSWLQFGFSYQHQGDIDIQSKPQKLPTTTGSLVAVGQFMASLRLDAFAVKAYINTPRALIMKGTSYSAYFGVGTGPCWQSWTNMTIDSANFFGSGLVPTAVRDDCSLKNKYCANWFVMLDPGFKIQSVIPNRGFSVLVGCKFNLWGQARNLGDASKMKDWAGVSPGLAHPIGIKTIYQFAPYLGFELDF